MEFEIIFVDDGSKDGTLEIMRKLSEQDPKIHYISFSRNFGKEAALYAGLERAKGDYVIYHGCRSSRSTIFNSKDDSMY